MRFIVLYADPGAQRGPTGAPPILGLLANKPCKEPGSRAISQRYYGVDLGEGVPLLAHRAPAPKHPLEAPRCLAEQSHQSQRMASWEIGQSRSLQEKVSGCGWSLGDSTGE